MSEIDEILGEWYTSDLTEAEIKALKAYRGELPPDEGLSERGLAVLSALEWNDTITSAERLSERLEAWTEQLEGQDAGLIPADLASRIAEKAGVPTIIVDLVFEVANEVCDVCIEV